MKKLTDHIKTKYEKEEVNYTDNGHKNSHCSICKHWVGHNKCKVVKGYIMPGGWCEKFKKW